MPITLSSPAPGPPPVSLVRPRLRYRFANAEFDEARHCLTVDGQPVDLEPRPRQLLLLLLHHADQVLTKEELHRQVWGNRPTVDNVLPSAVRKLRTALGPGAAARIVTLPRVGYRLDGPVAREDADSADPTIGEAPGGQDLLTWAHEQGRLSTLPTPARLDLLQQLATALASAHNLGVLHRGLHPGCVRIEREAGRWRARLEGFLRPGQGVRMDPETLAASSIYTAPEVLKGHPPTAQADLFSLGTMGHQLICGDMRHPPPAGRPPSVDDGPLSAAFIAATAPDPAHRPGSVAQWLQQLVQAQALGSTTTTPPHAPPWAPAEAATPRWGLSWRRSAAAVICLLVLLAIGLDAAS